MPVKPGDVAVRMGARNPHQCQREFTSWIHGVVDGDCIMGTLEAIGWEVEVKRRVNCFYKGERSNRTEFFRRAKWSSFLTVSESKCTTLGLRQRCA